MRRSLSSVKWRYRSEQTGLVFRDNRAAGQVSDSEAWVAAPSGKQASISIGTVIPAVFVYRRAACVTCQPFQPFGYLLLVGPEEEKWQFSSGPVRRGTAQ
jgi:hypothetical protein